MGSRLLTVALAVLMASASLAAALLCHVALFAPSVGDGLKAKAPRSNSTFAVLDDSFGEGEQTVRLKVLVNTLTQERLEVAWNRGGRTEALLLRRPGTAELRGVLLDSRRNASDVHQNVGWKGDLLIPYANRIKNGTYTLQGQTYYMERNEDRGSYGKNGLHGYLYRKVMRVQGVKVSNASAELTLDYDFDGSDPGYPFALGVSVTYTLSTRGVEIATQARNLAAAGPPAPFFNSWHSYFRVTDISKAYVELDRCASWEHIDVSNNSNVFSDLIPTGGRTPFRGFNGSLPVGGTPASPTYWDDEFKASNVESCAQVATRIRDGSTGDVAVLWADKQHPWVQVFTGTLVNFGEQAIAIEAMSGQADAWNNGQGLRLLAPGESWEGSMGVYLEAAGQQESAGS